MYTTYAVIKADPSNVIEFERRHKLPLLTGGSLIDRLAARQIRYELLGTIMGCADKERQRDSGTAAKLLECYDNLVGIEDAEFWIHQHALHKQASQREVEI